MKCDPNVDAADLCRIQPATPAPSRLDHLDMLRGIAALAVMAQHLRGFVFQTYSSNPAAVDTVLAKIFYFSTGLGHQCVIVFFALSGYLVGGKSLTDLLHGRFQWPLYLARRLTRLWLVIIPAIFLTLAFDSLGLAITRGEGYDGRYWDVFNSGPSPPAGVSHDGVTLIGNIVFVQTIFVPIFGSNGPMWSLANEFWYYVFFPLIPWIILSRTNLGARIAGGLIAAALAYALPFDLLVLGLIWVAGALAAFCASLGTLKPIWSRTAVRFLALMILAGTILLTKMPQFGVGDLTLGFVVAAALPVLALLPPAGFYYRNIARALSELSYTLYLTHFPLLTLIALVCLGPDRFAPGLHGGIIFIVLFVTALAWAVLVWWCFERNTDSVYRRLVRIIRRDRLVTRS